jgi:serine/threonine protein kinase
MVSDSNNESTKLLDDYIIVEQVGSGSFGEIYLAEYKKGYKVAIKIEERKKTQRIYNEYKIYRHLQKQNFVNGLPMIYDYLQSPDYNIMVMQLLGPCLEDLFVKCNKKFKLPTVFMLANQLLSLLNKLHDAEYIHRDIKPNNFLIGKNDDASQIYIIDFGLSKRYTANNKHIKFHNNRSLIGTARYASINMHMGIEPSRRDDLESAGYMLIYFLKGELPWQGIKKKKGINHIEAIGDIKICTCLEKLCEGIPDCFREYLDYCRKLKFDEKPDYEYLKRLFRVGAIKTNIVPEFEWL